MTGSEYPSLKFYVPSRFLAVNFQGPNSKQTMFNMLGNMIKFHLYNRSNLHLTVYVPYVGLLDLSSKKLSTTQNCLPCGIHAQINVKQL